MNSNIRSWGVTAAVLAIIIQVAASAQTQQRPVAVNFCDVIASPDEYNSKVLTVEGVLHPSEHVLTFYSPSCAPKEGFDVTTKAVLPTGWASSPNGKSLRKFLKKGKEARVKLTGTFEIEASHYGLDATRFRFTVTGISSVEKAPPDFHL
jgi:hypothetical protein